MDGWMDSGQDGHTIISTCTFTRVSHGLIY